MIKELTVRVVASYVSHNALSTEELSAVIGSVGTTFSNLLNPPATAELKAPSEPAVPIKRSVTPDYLICLEDGKKLKMLKRHLRATYNMSPEEYRTKWNLPPDYPMTAPNYSMHRSTVAKEIGLGKNAGRQ